MSTAIDASTTARRPGPSLSAAMTIDPAKMEAFVGKTVEEFGAIVSSALTVIGDKLGLFKAMAGAGPLTADEIASRTGSHPLYLHPWLVNQAAGGNLSYDPTTGRYELPLEQAVALTDETSPYYVGGGFGLLTSAIKAEPRIAEVFKTGEGLSWGEHDSGLFHGTERFFRPGYGANLIPSWIPALDGAEEKLKAGATVADIGCGHGASTIIMAEAYPRSRFFGFDFHAPSIERAQQAAAEAGVADRVVFAVSDAASYPGTGYDLIAFFDSFHDLGDPAAAARHARETIAPGGWLLLVEPMAGEKVEDNLNPVGRLFSAASVLICTPNALAGGGNGHAHPPLGTIATEHTLRDVVTGGGFSAFRRANETPVNRIFEARP